MQLEEIFQIMDKFEDSTLSEFAYKTESEKIFLKKELEQQQTAYENRDYKNVSHKQESKKGKKEDGIFSVKAPLIGTFYRASKPDAKPYIMIGQKVKKGDVLGIIEAMKLMNEVLSPVNGEITEILAENDELVQYDEVLFKIKESTDV